MGRLPERAAHSAAWRLLALPPLPLPLPLSRLLPLSLLLLLLLLPLGLGEQCYSSARLCVVRLRSESYLLPLFLLCCMAGSPHHIRRGLSPRLIVANGVV